MDDATSSNAGRIAAGVIAALALVVSAIVIVPMTRPDAEPEMAPKVEEVAAAPVVEPVLEEPAAPAESEIAAEPEIAEEPEVAEAAEPEAPPPPTFDTFRVEPDGSMVIAGRAQPGQIVDIMLSGTALERVTVDAGGNFVALPVAGFSDQPRVLSLLADPEGDAIASEVTYIVAPILRPEPPASLPEAPEGPLLTADAEDPPSLDVDGETESIAPDAPTLRVADNSPPAPPTVLQADSEGIRVVQAAPSPAAPVVSENVVLDAITYDPEGEVLLSGRATGDGAVQIYIDNQPVTASAVEQGGDWRIGLPDIDTGVYTLRIDEVDTDGAVVSRIETPFKREEAEDVAAVLAEETAQDGFEVAVKTVQPGATLWAIAEENLGDGILYVEVFEANADLIKDPDLIYPGQIFRIPEITQ